MVGIGNIVSVGGAGGTGGGGGTSGIQILNGQTGPTVTLVGTSGVIISPVAPNIINIGTTATATIQSGVFGVNGIDVQQISGDFIVDGAALSGLIIPSGGIGAINGQIGPVIEIAGINGINVTVSSENEILIDGAGGSGTLCFAETFTSITSSTFTHNLSSTNVIIDVFDDSDNKIMADRVGIVDSNNVIVEFNRPQTGKVVVVACISGLDSNQLLCEAKRYALLVS